MRKLFVLALALVVAAAANYKLVCDDEINAQWNNDFNYQLQTIGGSGRYGYQVEGLPEGLKNQGPVIAGIPKTSGRYSVKIRSYDDAGNYDVKSVTFNVGGDSSVTLSADANQLGTSSGSSSSSSGSSSRQTTSSTITVNGATISSSSKSGDADHAGSWAETTDVNLGGSTGVLNIGLSGPTTIGGSTSSTDSTSGSSSVTGSSTTVTKTIISNLAVPSAGYTPNYPTGSSSQYPTEKFPTGASANYIPSNLPTQISNYQYTVDASRDSYQVTQADIQSQAVFQRQINANKAIANLLSIIEQLTANVNGAQGDIPAATQAVNQAIADQRAIQQKIVAAENANKTLTANIETVRTEISTFQQTLTTVSANIRNSQGPIDSSNTLKVTIGLKITDSQTRLTTQQNALVAARDSVQSAKDDIATLSANISKIQTQISNIQQDINSGPSFTSLYDSKVKDYNNAIADLEAQLADLRNKRDDAKSKADYYRTINATGGSQIRQWQSFVNSLTNQINTIYQPALDSGNDNIAKISSEIDALQSTIANLIAKSKEVDIALANAKRNRDGLTAQYTSIVSSINRSTTILNNLLSQAPSYNNALVQAYNDGNDANDRYFHLKGVLDALSSKYLTSLKELNEAKATLEKVRTEKDIADIAVNEQIRKQGGSTILPYSIPGVTGNTRTVTVSSHASGPSGGRWIVSGTDKAEGTLIGTTSTGIPIIAGSSNTGATGVVLGQSKDGSLVISGWGVEGAVIGKTASGASILGSDDGSVVTTKVVTTQSAIPVAPKGDLSHYISNSLTQGVSSTVLYPFILTGSVALSNFSCSGKDLQEEGATISSVGSQGFGITNSKGEEYSLKIGGCTKLEANHESYQPSVGDRVRWSGWKNASSKSINAASVACYA